MRRRSLPGLAKCAGAFQRLCPVTFLFAIFRWVAAWLYYVSVVVFCGAAFGALSHLAFARIFLDAPDYYYIAAFGFLNGLKLSGIWAGGLGIVLCFMRAHRMRQAGDATGAEAPGQ